MQAMNWGKKKKKEFNLCIEIVFCDKILQKNNVNIYSARVRVSLMHVKINSLIPRQVIIKHCVLFE